MFKKIKLMIDYLKTLSRKKKPSVVVTSKELKLHSTTNLVDMNKILKCGTKAVDPKQKIAIKFKTIARRTKSGRIRKKNMKRLYEVGVK